MGQVVGRVVAGKVEVVEMPAMSVRGWEPQGAGHPWVAHDQL